MAVVYISVILFLTFIALVREKNLYNPGVLFGGLWLFVGILSFMNLYSFNDVSNRAYGVALMGVICFFIGVLMRNRVKVKAKKSVAYKKSNADRLRYGFLIPFYSFVLAFTARMFARSLSLLRRGVTMEKIRFNYRSVSAGIVVKSIIEYDVEHYIVAVAEFAAVALLPIVLMDKKSWKKRVLFIEIAAFLVMHMFVTGARSFIFDVAIVFVIYVLMNRNLKEKFSHYFRKIPKVIIFIVIVTVALLFTFVTQLRRGSGYLLHEIYAYFSISFRLLDTHLSIMDLKQEFTNGMTFLHGFLRPILVTLKFVGIPYPESYQKAIDLINANNDFYAVGKGSANSFVTVFYYFYMDFGYLSVVVGSMLYGYVSQALYLAVQKKPDKRNQSMYLLYSIGLVLSFVRLHFTAHRYAYAFLILFFAFGHVRSSIKEKENELREKLERLFGEKAEDEYIEEPEVNEYDETYAEADGETVISEYDVVNDEASDETVINEEN